MLVGKQVLAAEAVVIVAVKAAQENEDPDDVASKPDVAGIVAVVIAASETKASPVAVKAAQENQNPEHIAVPAAS